MYVSGTSSVSGRCEALHKVLCALYYGACDDVVIAAPDQAALLPLVTWRYIRSDNFHFSNTYCNHKKLHNNIFYRSKRHPLSQGHSQAFISERGKGVLGSPAPLYMCLWVRLHVQ